MRCATYIILPDRCYTRPEKTIASSGTLRRLRHHKDHRLDLQCHPYQHVCSPFEVEGEGEGEREGRVDRQGRARDGGSGHGPDSDNGLGTLEPTLPTSIPSYSYPSPEMFIPPDTCTSPSIPTHIDTSPSLPPHTYTSPSILPDTYTSVPYPVSKEPVSIAVDITLSSHPLPSHTLPPMDDTFLDLLPEWGRLPARRPRT